MAEGFLREPRAVFAASALALALAGCAGGMGTAGGPATPTAVPPTVAAEDLVGRWGLASYHKEGDRARTEVAARGQCRQPYTIGRGPSGGVMMHLADARELQELRVKGSAGGKNYIGPPGEPAGPSDREIVSFDGRLLVLRWVDPDISSRYGTMLFVRCGPRA